MTKTLFLIIIIRILDLTCKLNQEEKRKSYATKQHKQQQQQRSNKIHYPLSTVYFWFKFIHVNLIQKFFFVCLLQTNNISRFNYANLLSLFLAPLSFHFLQFCLFVLFDSFFFFAKQQIDCIESFHWIVLKRDRN